MVAWSRPGRTTSKAAKPPCRSKFGGRGFGAKDYQEAKDIMEDTCRRRRRVYGAKHPETLAVMQELANLNSIPASMIVDEK